MPVNFNQTHRRSKIIIYVLGGSQKSLEYRFKIAASLYKNCQAHKILIFSRPGITEYDPLLGRNLTNNEWAIRRLEELGVQKEYIEPLSIKYVFFGTLAEARRVSREVINRNYDVLILVTSSYHTKRVFESFSNYLNNKGISVFTYSSDDSPELWGLFLEYFKLLLYRNIIL